MNTPETQIEKDLIQEDIDSNYYQPFDADGNHAWECEDSTPETITENMQIAIDSFKASSSIMKLIRISGLYEHPELGVALHKAWSISATMNHDAMVQLTNEQFDAVCNIMNDLNK